MKGPKRIDVVCTLAAGVFLYLFIAFGGCAIEGLPGAGVCKVLCPICAVLTFLSLELPYMLPERPRKKARKKPLPVRQHKQGRAERVALKNQHDHYSRRRSA